MSLTKSTFLAFALACSGFAQGIITTVAGSGTQRLYAGDGGPASAATFGWVYGPVVDAAGNIYVPDSNHIRRIGADGIITTIAGTGVAGSSGDGGPALSARLGGINQLAVSGSRLCFGDNAANKIRCIDLSTGIIQGYGTGAAGTSGDGGNVASASFKNLWGAAFDDSGRLYVSDFGAHSIRRVDFTTGIITLFAGPGPGYSNEPLLDGGPALGANLLDPMGLAFGNGALYIADQGNSRIRRVDLASNIISTVAGNGSSPYTAGTDGSLAVNVGVAPSTLALDPDGNIFFVNTGSTIKMIDTSGILTTIANTSGNQGYGADDIPALYTVFDGISGLAWDPIAKRLLISDNGAQIRQIFYLPATAITVTPSKNPAGWRETIILTAAVSAIDATGSVRFYYNYPYQASIYNWILLGSAPLVNGVATYPWTAPVGDNTWAFSAVYGGDPTHNLSESPTVTETVWYNTSTINLSSSLNPASAGQSVTLTANVLPAAATGTITFLNSGVALGTATVSGGVATLTLSTLPRGSNAITASYSGDTRYVPGVSAVLNQAIKSAATLALATTPNPSAFGAPVSLTAIVSPATATGTIQFLNGTTSLGSATLVNGQAVLSTSALPTGANSLTATYAGDSLDSPATAPALTQTISPAPAAITFASSANPAPVGQSVAFTAAITPASATGTIQLLDGATVIGSTAIAAGTAVISVSGLSLGDHPITASYAGDTNTAPATSAVLIQTISKIATTVVAAVTPNPAFEQQTVTITAAMTPSASTGLVQIFEGSGLLGTVPVNAGVATLTLTSDVYAFPAGPHSLTVNYNGDATHAFSTTAATLTVNRRAATTITLSATPAPSVAGQSVAFTAQVSPSAATGTVLFVDGTTQIGSATLTGGTAVFTTAALAAGTHNISAVYNGDTAYSGNGVTIAQTVKIAATVALSVNNLALVYGQTAALAASVSPTSATGTVQFLDGATVIGTATLSAGVATLATAALAPGAHTLTAVYAGDGLDAAATSSPIAVSVDKAATALALASTLNPALPGQPVTFTAQLTPATATGTVIFLDGSTQLGTAILTGGAASLSTAALGSGSHTINATYSGDPNFNASAASVAQTVKATTTTALSASNPAPITGQTVTLTASVTPAAATGTVQFLDGATVIATATLSGGAATFATSTLSVGPHTLTAAYTGDALDGTSASSPVTVTVGKATTTLAATSSPNPALPGQPIVFTASVSPATATGTVQFLDGTTVIGTATLTGGAASLTAPALAAGNHPITATYSGDSNFNASTAGLTQTVKSATTTALSVNNPAPAIGQTVTFTASVSPAAATGTVQFLDSASVIGTATLSSGTAAFATYALSVGTHAVTAVYAGDALDVTSTSSPVSVAVDKAAAVVVLTSAANPSLPGQSVQFTAAVSPATATGTVQFLDGATLLATVPVAAGAAAFNTAALASGAHTITAVYSGDAADKTASAALTQTVKAVASVALSTSNPSVAAGQSVTFTATVSPSAATGSIQFLDGTTPLGTVALANHTAALSLTTLAVGVHGITAVYGGDSNDAPATSAAVSQTITAPLPTAPTYLTATAASTTQINLAWTASTTSGVTYSVYASATSPFTPATSNRIATGLTATTYAHTGLTAATTRYYLVTAVNATGASAPSNLASATTKSAGASCKVVYTITTQWNVGFGTALTIQNTGATAINGWNLTWTWPSTQAINQSWNADYTQTGANATLKNASWNGTIAPGATVTGIGFNATYNGTNPNPAAFYLNGTLCQ